MKKSTLIVMALVMLNVFVNGQRVFVNQNATGAENGTSWENAYTQLNTAIANASAGDTVFVASGI